MISQLGLRQLNEKEEVIANTIIGNIDDDGYVRRELPALTDDIAFGFNLSVTEAKLKMYYLLFKILNQQVLVREIYKNAFCFN